MISKTAKDFCSFSYDSNLSIWKDPSGNVLSKEGIQIMDKSAFDLFAKSNPKKFFLRKSYWVYYLDHGVIAGIGYDGKLRVSLFDGEEWQENVAPACLGVDVLEFIANNYLNEEIILEPVTIGYLQIFDSGGFCAQLPVRDELFSRLPEGVQVSG